MATPMLEQYNEIKKQNPDCLLLFRLGDFYEGFAEDAKVLSKVLALTLTGRGERENRVAMAGIPHHALKNYLPKLIKAGYKVAIADQMEEPIAGQLVKREVTKIITAGTILDENEIELDKNNYIASIYLTSNRGLNAWGLSYADVSTGEFKLNQYVNSGKEKNIPPSELIMELFRISPSEIIIQSSLINSFKEYFPSFNLVGIDDRQYFTNELKNDLLKYYDIVSFKSFGLDDYEVGLISSAKLLDYVKVNRKLNTPKLQPLTLLESDKFMYLDKDTILNLEILSDLRGANSQFTIFNVLNHCMTGMGQRLLRQWIIRPLKNADDINERLDRVDFFFKNPDIANEVIQNLNNVPDLDRLISKISGKSANARDLKFLSTGLSNSIKTLEVLNSKEFSSKDLSELKDSVIRSIENTIKDDPAITITEGDIIKDGVNKELDDLRKVSGSGNDFLKTLESDEIKRTGISSLKIRYNRVFGYYIEISNSNLDKVPSNYIRKQTLVNAERFITEELKTWEEKILSASELINQKEYQIFEELRDKVIENFNLISKLSKTIAEIDVFLNFAQIAIKNNYNKPKIFNDHLLNSTKIINSRHPVVENFMKEAFIPNDVNFIPKTQEFIMLTGPNMSGKSTYIRQVAIIFLMAQIGSFVPCDSAEIPVCDRIFTRVGASDNLAQGESTFMVEMLETANILNNATSKSIVILDEIGRGTSTYDGMAIAWSVSEFIAKKIQCRTMFATHYHDLLLLEDLFDNIKNFNIQVIESGSEVTFMHKIEKGGLNKSYGIHVAKLAGIPTEVIKRAEKVQFQFQKKSIKSYIEKHNLVNESQIGLMNQQSNQVKVDENPLKKELENLDINSLTPINALNKLKELQEIAQK